MTTAAFSISAFVKPAVRLTAIVELGTFFSWAKIYLALDNKTPSLMAFIIKKNNNN